VGVGGGGGDVGKVGVGEILSVGVSSGGVH